MIGRNVLCSMVKNMCAAIGVEGKTNHSLHATGATRLFESSVPEKLIQEHTGHRSLDSLRLYERTSTSQQKSESNLLCSPVQIDYQPPTSSSVAMSTSHPLTQGPNMFQNCSNCTINVNINNR